MIPYVLTVVAAVVITIALQQLIARSFLWRDREHQDMLDLVTSLQALNRTASKSLEFQEQVPLLVQGLTDLCRLESDKTDALTGAMEMLQKTMAPDPHANPYEEYADDPSESVAERREVVDLIDAGVSAEEAKRRSREAQIYRRAAGRR